MLFIVDIEKALNYSVIDTARCGESVHVHWGRNKPSKNQKELHEEKCPSCQESYRTGIIPDYAEMHRIRMEGWMKDYVEKNKE